MTINRLKQGLTNRTMRFINERRGWKTDRKIVVIESDDWGSIRMPSTDVLQDLMRKGIMLHPEAGYDKYDTLASNQDLESLMNILSSVNDMNGNPAKITLNYLMANPDFNKIKESEFTEYHYELFTDTLKRYPNHDKSFDLVKEGTKQKMFQPQFHGREHLNVQMWMSALKNDIPGVREAFNSKVFCNYIKPILFDKRYRFLEKYNVNKKEEYNFVVKSIEEGLMCFEKIFGFKSKSMIAPNYLWDPILEKTFLKNGVNIFQGSIYQNYSEYNKKHTGNNGVFHYLGEKNKKDQVYLTRNCTFEPSTNIKSTYETCFKSIDNAFRLKKPAIVSSHRVNYIGGLEKKNRSNNLKQLAKLFKKLIKQHPEVEFMSSDELGNIIFNDK